jgi:hypothetical protein
VSICARGAERLAATHDEIARHGAPRTPRSATWPTGRRSRATSQRPPRGLAGSTSWSTTPPRSAPSTTRADGRQASRSICWRRCARSAQHCRAWKTSPETMAATVATDRANQRRCHWRGSRLL